jgi:hypothetical protein
MSGEVDPEEDSCIRERRRRDDVLPCDVDAGEPDDGQDPDDDEEREFPVTRAQLTNLT